MQYLLFNLTAYVIFSKLRKVIILDASSTDMIRIEKSLQAMVSCLCVIENHDNRLLWCLTTTGYVSLVHDSCNSCSSLFVLRTISVCICLQCMLSLISGN